MDKLYQVKYKEEFLKEFNNDKLVKWIFDKMFEFENRYNKDLFDFNKEQILEYFSSRNLKESTIKNQLNTISNYIKWADSKNLRNKSNNPVKEITASDIKKVAKKSHEVLHIDAIDEIVGRNDEDKNEIENVYPQLKNAQDRLLIYLIFNGVSGNRANEILSLTFDNIDGNVVKLSELDPYRKDITIDDHGMDLIRLAKKEDSYHRYLDEVNPGLNQHNYDLEPSNNVIRKSAVGKRNDDDGKMNYHTLLSRLKSISKFLDEKITIKRIEKSGQVYVGWLLKEAGFKLEVNEPAVIKSLFERFNIETYHKRWSTLKFVKEEIEKVYNEDHAEVE